MITRNQIEVGFWVITLTIFKVHLITILLWDENTFVNLILQTVENYKSGKNHEPSQKHEIEWLAVTCKDMMKIRTAKIF